MRYGGSEAFDLTNGAAWEYAEQATLSPIEGGRLDARARSEVSPIMMRVLGYVAAIAIALFVAGGASVALTSGTVALLQANTQASAQIQEMNEQNGSLRIERSLLARADRISRIATQNLNMVYASDAHVMSVD